MTWAITIALTFVYLAGGLATTGVVVLVCTAIYAATAVAYELGKRSRDTDVIRAYHEGKARADEWWETTGVRMAQGARRPEEPRPKKPRAKVAPHWKLLGLKPWATAEQIKGAYHRLAMKWHPDHGGSNEKMQELNRAREAALRETKV